MLVLIEFHVFAFDEASKPENKMKDEITVLCLSAGLSSSSHAIKICGGLGK